MANAKTDFSISVNVNPDTSQVQKTLNQQKFIIKADIRTKDAEESIKRLNTFIQNTGKLNGFERINTQIKTGLTGFDQYNNKLSNLTKYTETFKNALGDTTQRITVMTEKGKILTSSFQTISNGVKEITTDTRTATQTINGLENKITVVGKTITDTSGKTQTIIERTREWVDANGRLNKEVQTLNSNGEQLAPTITTISNNTKKLNSNIKQTGSSASQSAKDVKTFGQALSDAFSRLSKYYLASLPIQAFREAISEAITTVKEFDSALIEFRKVSDLAGESLTNYVAKLAEMGEVTGSTMQAMVEASTEFRKSGFSDEDSAKLASIAEKYRNIADEEISAGESASFIIAQMKAFNIEADQAEHIIDSVNEVANNFSVSSADLAKNLGNMSAIMAINNVSMEEQIGMLTGVTEITRNASSASRGLVMISSRLTQVLDDTSSTGKKLTDIYDGLGIALKDQSGQLRSHFDILGDLAAKWNTLSENEQKYIALTSAGARQQQNFVSLMENWNQVVKATTTAYESMGSAQKENEKVMDSVAKKVEILKSEFQQIVIGKGGLQEFAKGLLDVGIEALKVVDSLGGLPSILITLTSLIVSLNALNIYKNITNIVKGIKDIPMVLTRATLSWNAYKAGVVSANVAMEATVPIIGAVGAALGLIISAIVTHNKKIEEQKEKVKENIQAFNDEYNVLNDVSKKLQDENISREELNKIIDSNLDEYEAERIKLLDINSAREETIRLIEEEKKAKAQELIDTGLTVYEEALDNLKNGFKEFDKIQREALNYSNTAKKAGIFDANTQKEQIDALKKYHQLLITSRSEFEKGTPAYAERTKEIQKVETSLSSLTEEYKNNTKTVRDMDTALDTMGKHYVEATGEIIEGSKKSYIAIEEQRKGLEKLSNNNKKSAEELKNLKKQYNITDDAIYEYIDTHQDEIVTVEEATEALINEAIAQEGIQDSTEKLEKEYKELHEETKNLTSSISKVASALKEQAENGSIAVETQLELIEAGYGAALSYDKETGACKLNEKAVQKLVEAKLEMQIANLQIQRSNIASKLIEEANAAVVSAGAFLELAKAKNLANQAVLDYSGATGGRNASDPSKSTSGYGGNFGYLVNDSKKATDQINILNDEISALQSSLKGIKTSGVGAFGGIKSGAKGAKSATDDLNKSLEDTKKKYEQVISWISKQYDKEIDSIKKSEKEALEAEESKIKAKEKEKDNALDAIEKEINALEKEKKALKEQKEALDEHKQALKDEQSAIIDSIEKRIKILEKERDALIKPVEARIKALESERDAIIEATQAEIDSINELKDKRQSYWDEQIDALKNANKELKDNLELQEKLDALAKAKNTKVKIYKEGQGFVYDVDQNAVNEAQKALDEYLSQKAYEDELARLEALKDAEINSYNDRLKELNNYKDNTKKSYDKQLDDLKKYKEKTKDYYDEQIENLKEYKESVQEQYEEKIKILEKDIDALEKHMDELDKHKESLEEHKDAVQEAYEAEIEELENHKEAVQEAYESEIETWEGYKQAFEDMVNAYEEQQNRLLFQQLTGITDESNNWMTRLDNLAEFVRKYNELQAQLNTGNTDVSNNASMSSGGSSSGGYSGGGSSNTRTVTNYSKPSGATNYTPTSNTNYRRSGIQSALSHQGYHGMPTNVKRYASGTGSIKDDEIAVVGENPNKEIVLGSKINNGELMSLGKGTGIVNADSSKTLASMLNQVGQFGSSGFGSGSGTLNNNINNDSLVVNGVTIEGSNISDPQTFVNGLLNLKAEALQRAYKHR